MRWGFPSLQRVCKGFSVGVASVSENVYLAPDEPITFHFPVCFRVAGIVLSFARSPVVAVTPPPDAKTCLQSPGGILYQPFHAVGSVP